MPKKEEFVLKDSPPELIAASGVEPKGREFDAAYEGKPGAVRREDLFLGTKLACVAITDDKPETLAKIGKSNPWHIKALTMITGSEEEAHKPLTHILKAHFGLEVDEIINLHGWSGGHPIDTQGYIAHNDEMIVVSFRCTTSAMDWMTNFAIGSSEWELDKDLPKGNSGWFSALEGRGFWGTHKPRVHTGFYNNILKTIPILQEFVDPLLAHDQPPRKLYVVGHSLGAGMSTMATIYFLENHDWKNLPHKYINIGAGTPRSCKRPMAELMEQKLAELGPLDKAIVCRVVNDEDLVARVPTTYIHFGKLVYLTEDEYVLVGPKDDDEHVIDEEEMKELCESNPQLAVVEKALEEKEKDDAKTKEDKITPYKKMMQMIPIPIRDHCPDYYLAPLVKLCNANTESHT